MSKTVLIADESVTIRSVAESLLRGESFSVHSAADGNMALELAHAEQPDLALIGEKLGGLDGVEICRTMKTDDALKHIPVIYMRTDRPGATPEHVDGILTKPFSPQSLLDTVRRFVQVSAPGKDTAPFGVPTAGDESLEEELIDQALGLDDVGPTPAQELDVSSPSARTPLETSELAEEEDATPLGTIETPETETAEGIEELQMDSALDSAFGIGKDSGPVSLDDDVAPAAPAKQPEPPAQSVDLDSKVGASHDDVDDALDAAFGEMSASETGASGRSHDTGVHSLKEVSLNEESVDLPVPERPATPSSSAAPGGGIDLGGESEEEADRPHDYDWFINEMKSETDKPSQPEPAPQPPSIEPVTPQVENSADLTVEGREDVEEPKPTGYDQFISEFKAEIAKLEGMAAPAEADDPNDSGQASHSQAGSIAFDENTHTPESSEIRTPEGPLASPPPPQPQPAAPPATTADLQALGDELINTVTAQVARELAAKIDSKMIYQLIEQKLKEAQERK